MEERQHIFEATILKKDEGTRTLKMQTWLNILYAYV
jgi:hypothetical protein